MCISPTASYYTPSGSVKKDSHHEPVGVSPFAENERKKKKEERIQFYLDNVVSVENSSGVTTISVLTNCALHLFRDDTHRSGSLLDIMPFDPMSGDTVVDLFMPAFWLDARECRP